MKTPNPSTTAKNEIIVQKNRVATSVKLAILSLIMAAGLSSCYVSAHPYGSHWVPGHYEQGPYRTYYVRGHWS